MVKINICVSIDYENSQIPSQKLSGNIESIRNKLDSYDIPIIGEKKPVSVSSRVTDEANLPQNKSAINFIAKILNYHLFERIRPQLLKIPNQLLTTKFSAALLHICPESLLKLLDRGEIPFQTLKNSKCIQSINLLEYIKQLEQTREDAFFQMRQCEY